MSIRIRVALTSAAALAAVTSVGLIAPAAMAGPKLPDGCTFDRSTGTSTCTTATVGDKTSQDYFSPVVRYPDDTFAGTFCSIRVPKYFGYGGQIGGAEVSRQTTTTTTSTFQGAYNSHKPVSSTTSSTTTYTVERGTVGCLTLDADSYAVFKQFNEGETAVVNN